MKVQPAKAGGFILDYLVAKASGRNTEYDGIAYWVSDSTGNAPIGCMWRATGKPCGYSPSTYWADGGPLIEQEGIDIMKVATTQWRADCGPACHGPTPLIATMRAFVVKKLGMEVEVPEELLK